MNIKIPLPDDPGRGLFIGLIRSCRFVRLDPHLRQKRLQGKMGSDEQCPVNADEARVAGELGDGCGGGLDKGKRGRGGTGRENGDGADFPDRMNKE
jgi:hypothetical protein